MPKQIEHGTPHLMRAAVAAAKQALLTAFALQAPVISDAGSAQRAIMGRHPINSAHISPVPQRLAIAPAMEYAGYTRPAQRIVTVPNLTNASPAAPQVFANPYPAGNVPAILPSGTRLPLT